MNKEIIIKLLRIILAAVFIFSAISKLIAPGIFEITILDQGIIESRELAAYIGRILIAVELFLGIALLQANFLKQVVLPATLLTLTGFTILLLFSHFDGNSNNCGCFGEFIKMSPLEAIIKNIFLIVLGIFVFQSTDKNSNKLYIPIVILFISIGFVFTFAPIKSYKDLVFSKYIDFENEGRVDLTEGDKLVAIFFIDCEHCMETANEIITLENETSKLEDFYILFSGEESDSVKHFLAEANIEHPYLRIPIEDFFDLIGNAPPRIYWLQNGEIKEYWDDNFRNKLSRYLNLSIK